MTDETATWDEAHLKALLQLSHSPLHLIQAPPWSNWIQQQGGLKAIYRYFLNLEELAEDQRHLLRVILEHPRQTADFYAAGCHISRKTYFRLLRKLLPVLEHSLNGRPPLSLPHAPASNLPAQVTSFIGRGKEIAETKRLLSEAHLVTLTGPGGTGKTRLLLHVAADLLEVFSDGVWFVELAPLSDPGLVPQTVATALGVREIVGRPITETLTDYLRAKKDLLLLLDNCEHLVEACAQLMHSLLYTCPYLRLLASSREVLGIAGEIPFPVPSLSLPDPKKPLAVENLIQYEAIQLFIERAEAVLPGITLTSQNAPAVAHVCYQLDGIPLALELAAARVKMLKVEQIAARLDDRFRLLTGGSRAALPRQQTLRALIDWSYDLLSASECALLRRLSVFAGGWTLEAAEKVAGDWGLGTIEHSPVPNPQPLAPEEVLDLLTQLVNKSLVVVERELDQEGRYRLLETIRQYAREKLFESHEQEMARDQHLAFFQQLAEEAEPKLQGSEELAWMKRLETEHDNLRAALNWALENETTRTEAGLRLAGALYWFWHLGFHFSEGLEWLTRLLATRNSQTAPAAVRAKALTGTGWLMAVHLARGETPINAAEALALLQESLALFRQLDNKRGVAFTLRVLSAVYFYSRPPEIGRCRAALEEGLALFRELGDKFGLSEMALMLGYLAQAQADLAQAEVFFEEALRLRKELGNLDGIAWTLSRLGGVVMARGNYKRAKALFQESLSVWRELGWKQWITDSTAPLAELLLLEGDYRQAAALAEENLSGYQERGQKRNKAWSFLVLANASLGLGDYERAGRLLKESLSVCRDSGHQRGVAEALQTMAGVAVALGQSSRAARLFGAAETIFEANHVQLLAYQQVQRERDVAALRLVLDEAACANAWAEGRAMTLEQAVTYALEDAGG
jgi:predicted ATPase